MNGLQNGASIEVSDPVVDILIQRGFPKSEALTVRVNHFPPNAIPEGLAVDVLRQMEKEFSSHKFYRSDGSLVPTSFIDYLHAVAEGNVTALSNEQASMALKHDSAVSSSRDLARYALPFTSSYDKVLEILIL